MDARNLMTFFVCMCIFVGYALAGECCRAYYDLTSDYHETKWCDDYCCGASALGVLDCCSEALLNAPSSDRVSLCADFFLQNIWAPIVIGLGGLGMFICCIVCCVACCGGSKRGGVVNQAPQQPATNVIMMPYGGQYAQPPPTGHQPYGAYPGPAYPPQNQAFPQSYPGMPGSNPGEGNVNQPDTATKHPFATNEPSN